MQPLRWRTGRPGPLATAALAASLLSGCAPEYNWREVPGPDRSYRVMLPGKPASMTRRIRLEDLEVSMTMQGAQVGQTSFTVAVASLPDDRPETREKARAAMRAGMLRNIAGTERSVQPATVQVVDAAGAALGQEPAVRIEADGTANGGTMQMMAGFTARGARAYQWVVVGPQPVREQAQTFLDSFRLLQAGP